MVAAFQRIIDQRERFFLPPSASGLKFCVARACFYGLCLLPAAACDRFFLVRVNVIIIKALGVGQNVKKKINMSPNYPPRVRQTWNLV